MTRALVPPPGLVDALVSGPAPSTSGSGIGSLGSLRDLFNLGNPLSRDFVWWQVGRAAFGKEEEETSPSLLRNYFAPDWFFWGTVAVGVVGAGALAVHVHKANKKGR